MRGRERGEGGREGGKGGREGGREGGKGGREGGREKLLYNSVSIPCLALNIYVQYTCTRAWTYVYTICSLS